MEKIITILVFLVVGVITTWLQKKAQEKQERENPRPPVAPRPTITPRPIASRPAPPRPSSWEDELRRLLGDESAPPPAPRPAPTPPPAAPQPAPIIIATTRPSSTPAPRPIKVIPPSPVIPRPVSTPQPAPLATLTGAAQVEQSVRDLGAMQESARAYERARQLDTRTAGRIERATTEPVLATSVTRHNAPSAEVAQVVAMFRNARTTRQAVLASIILGPPKSLETA